MPSTPRRRREPDDPVLERHLSLADFERFDVQGGALVCTSPDAYSKELSIYDDDKTNDPTPVDACLTGDIVGACQCEFSGPTVEATLEGSLSL